jgi:ribonuclease BN (tRNA processing enzyme)
MPAMKLTVIGSSPAWPNPGSAHSGYLVEGAGRLLLDCGPGVLGRLRELDGCWPRIDAIAITHLHLDHWGDLVPWVWGSLFGAGAGGERPAVHLPPNGIATLSQVGSLIGHPDMFEQAFLLSEYQGGQPFAAAGHEVTPLRVEHYSADAYALRVRAGTTVLAYSGDSGPTDSLVEVARDADLFLCEATLLDGEPEPRGHLSLEEANHAFEASGARRLLITHRPCELSVDGDVQIARDGLELEL